AIDLYRIYITCLCNAVSIIQYSGHCGLKKTYCVILSLCQFFSGFLVHLAVEHVHDQLARIINNTCLCHICYLSPLPYFLLSLMSTTCLWIYIFCVKIILRTIMLIISYWSL